MSYENGSRVNGVIAPTQEPAARALHVRSRDTVVRVAILAAAGFGLTGCSSMASMNPVDWWHGLQGGPLAETRPPPPNADAPYPSLGTVPPKPAVPDAATRARIASGLVADRANAQYTASLSPLQAAPAAGSPPPAPPPKPAANDDQTSNATLQAASAPPAPPAPPPPRIGPLGPPQPPLPNTPVTAPRRAPVGNVEAAPLEPPAASAPPSAASASAGPSEAPSVPLVPQPPAEAGVPLGSPPAAPPAPPAAPARNAAARPSAARPGAPAAPTAVASASPGAGTALPGMPDQPPPAPQLAGVSLPRVTAPTPPPATPVPPPPPAPVVAPGGPVAVAFQPGSALLPVSSLGALKLLAQRHGDAPIAVTGYGDATSSDAAAQSAALPLALARARAIAANLLAAGVPANAIRVGAEAQGSGGAARVAN